MTVPTILASCLSAALAAAQAPPPEHNLVLTAPVLHWDEAIPLGNGLTGGLLWGGGREIHLGLDRGDLWDERPNGPAEWWKTQTWAKGGPMWEDAYRGAHPSKLPAGRVEITLPDGQSVREFELNYATGEAVAKLADGRAMTVFFSAVEPVAMVRLPAPPPAAVEVLSPLEVSKRVGGTTSGPDSRSVDALGYAPAATGSDGGFRWYLQEAGDGLRYGACVATHTADGETLMAVTLTSTADGPDPLALARQRCANALGRGYDALLAPHVAWWKNFWSQSQVRIPDAGLQSYHTFARYLYGSGSRRGAPPLPLQGVWTANNGALPPWKGDYHNDLNTQMTYIAYLTAGHFEEGLSWLDYLWRLKPVWTAFARDFYGTPGLSTPGVMTLAGQPLGGWAAYSLSPTMTAWNAHLFYLHWQHTMDDTFLRERAYPWCAAAAECLASLLKPDASGILKLPRSSSPEIHGNHWVTPNSNYDLMSMRMLFVALQEMADALGHPADAARWRRLSDGLGGYHVAPDGELLLAPDTPLRESHRHPSNLMAIYPFNLITCEGSAAERRIIAATLARPEWSKPTHHEWCGYTWAWMSCLHARVGDAEKAIRHLDVFHKAYLTRNGFHVNQDQSGMGFSAGGGRPFTLEGNFLGLQAVHEMLLQSWSPTPGTRDTGVIRVFPATPWRWHDASFADLRAEGGHRVSARRENNATTWLRITAGKDGEIRIRDNFGGRTPAWSRTVGKTDNNFTVTLKQGEVIEATLSKPAAAPPAPDDVAEPVVIKGVSGR